MPKHVISFDAKILRKQHDLPRYIVIKPAQMQGFSNAFSANVSLNDSAPFERNIRPWRKGSDVFFFNLTEKHCKQAGVDTGDSCRVRIEPIR